MKCDYFDIITVVLILSLGLSFMFQNQFDLSFIMLFILDLKICQMIYNKS